MSILASDIFLEVQELFIEPLDSGASWASNFWSASEVSQLLDNRQRQFLKDTGILLKRADISTTLNITNQPLPTDWIATQRMIWRTSAAVFTEVAKGDGWEADHGVPTWPVIADTPPKLWFDGEIANLNFRCAPAPSAAGGFQILYVYSASLVSSDGQMHLTDFPVPPLSSFSNSNLRQLISFGFTLIGVALEVPDEFAPGLKWGLMADMLNKLGRAQDVQRAAFCESRYQQAVAAARLILEGWSNV